MLEAESHIQGFIPSQPSHTRHKLEVNRLHSCYGSFLSLIFISYSFNHLFNLFERLEEKERTSYICLFPKYWKLPGMGRSQEPSRADTRRKLEQ